jgi:hypothetical protein
MSVIDVMVERHRVTGHRVTVFFDRCSPSSVADRRRIERAIDNSSALASADAASGAPETCPRAA